VRPPEPADHSAKTKNLSVSYQRWCCTNFRALQMKAPHMPTMPTVTSAGTLARPFVKVESGRKAPELQYRGCPNNYNALDTMPVPGFGLQPQARLMNLRGLALHPHCKYCRHRADRQCQFAHRAAGLPLVHPSHATVVTRVQAAQQGIGPLHFRTSVYTCSRAYLSTREAMAHSDKWCMSRLGQPDTNYQLSG
jgi:hypothetical protein